MLRKMMNMKSVRMRIPIILEKPGVLVGIYGKENVKELISRSLQGLGIFPDYVIEAKIDGKEGFLIIYLFDSEENAEKALKELSRLISSAGISGEVNRLIRVGKERYLPNFKVRGELLGVDVSIIPSKRIFSHLLAVFKMIGKGIPPVIRKIGEEEAKILARLELKGIEIEDLEDLFEALSFMMRVMECLGECPAFSLSSKGNTIEISLPKKLSPYGASIYRIYGLIIGFLREKGIKVEEIPEEPSGMKLKVYLPKVWTYIRVIAERS